jgi:hypothetical protein
VVLKPDIHPSEQSLIAVLVKTYQLDADTALVDVAISKLELNLPDHVHLCITHSPQREVRKLSVSPTSPKESQRQDVPFVLEPSLLKFEDLQDPRTRATGAPMPLACQVASLAPPPFA